MGLTGGCVRVCAPVPHRSATASVCQARLCFPASCRGDSSQQQLSCQGTGRMLLLRSCSLPVKNIPRGPVSGLLSMICPWGAAGVVLAGVCPGQAAREPTGLSGPNPYPNPSRASEAAEPRRSPGLWEAGLGLGFPARKPVAGWLLVAPTVTQGKRVAALAAPGRINQSAPLGLSPLRLPLEVSLPVPQLPKGEQTAQAAPEQAFPKGRHFQRSPSHCKFRPGSQVPCGQGGCSEHRRTLTFPCSCPWEPPAGGRQLPASVPTPGGTVLPGEPRVQAAPCRP